MHPLSSSVTAILLFITTASCQVLQFVDRQQPNTPFVTRLNVAHQEQVPAFVITSIDHRWKEQSNAADPNEQRVPVLISSNPSYTRSQYRYEQPQEAVPKTATSSADYDVTEDEANDPRFRFLYDALSKQYVAKYEAAAAANATPAPAASSPATEEPTTTAPTTTTTTTTEATTTTTATPSTSTTTEPQPSKEEVLYSHPSYRSVASIPSYDKEQQQYHQPSPNYPATASYHPVRAVKAENPSKYVPSDVFTIEQAANYRPRYFHSDAIFYQKALAFLRDYKETVLNNRQHGLTYRPNSETDDPTHVTNAYDELTPVIVRDREIPLVPKELLKPVAITELAAKPQTVSYDDHPAVEDKQLVGFLPIITLPKKVPRYPTAPSYTLLSSLAAQESSSAQLVMRKPAFTPAALAPAVPKRVPESKPSASIYSSIPTISLIHKPQSYKATEFEHTVPFLRVVKKQ